MSHRKTKRGKKTAWKLDDADWNRVQDVFPIKKIGPKGGRPPATNRRVFEALIWFCRNGCPWEQMPKNVPSWSPCRRRLIEWEEEGVFVAVHQHLLTLLDETGKLRLEETYRDGSFIPANGIAADQRSRGAKTSGCDITKGPRPERD